MNDTTAVTRNERGSRNDATQRAEAAQRNGSALIPPVDVIEEGIARLVGAVGSRRSGTIRETCT